MMLLSVKVRSRIVIMMKGMRAGIRGYYVAEREIRDIGNMVGVVMMVTYGWTIPGGEPHFCAEGLATDG